MEPLEELFRCCRPALLRRNFEFCKYLAEKDTGDVKLRLHHVLRYEAIFEVGEIRSDHVLPTTKSINLFRKKFTQII